MRTTKAAALQQFRYNWNVMLMQDPQWKDDKIAKRESWSIFTDDLCKDGFITLKQYETWTNPF